MRFLFGILLSACLAAAAQEYSTYIADSNEYHVAKIVADAAGNSYITGYRSIAIPGPTPATTSDVFVTKLDPAGSLVFTTTIGGKGADQAKAIALDSAGNIYVAGSTSSSNFPLHAPLQSQSAQMGTGFILKLSPDGSRILFSSYFGGTKAWSSIDAITLDRSGNLYLAGTTYASDYPAGLKLGPAAPYWGVGQYAGAIIAKLTPAADRILFSAILTGSALTCTGGSSCFLGSRFTNANAIAVDAAGAVTIAGNTNTTDLPASGGALLTRGFGAFVARLKPDGSALEWLTYLSPAIDQQYYRAASTVVTALALDAAGDAVIAGSTTDTHFPLTPGAAQRASAGQDAFVAKLKPDGSGMIWATLLGGTAADAAQSIALDSVGQVWVSGTSASSDFPNADGWSSGSEFLTGLKPGGSALVYSAQFPAGTVAQSVSTSGDGLIHTAGINGVILSLAPAHTATPRIFGLGNSAYASALSGRIAPGELISIYGPHLGVTGTQVTIGGTPAPVLYVSDSQINVIVPFEVAGQSTAHVSVVSNGAALPDFPVIIADAVPEIFRNPDGSAIAVNQDGSLNSASNPAKAGSTLSFWATGTGAIDPPDGHIATAALDYGCCSVYLDSGTQVDMLYAGASPGLVAGVTQVNIMVPASPDPAGGPAYIQVRAGNRAGAIAAIFVAP